MRTTLLLILALLTACRAEPTADAAPTPRAVVWVVRHAEAWKNVEPRPLLPEGQLDELTPRGTRQAEAIAARLTDRGVTAVLHSPTGRTAATAEILAAATGVAAESTAALAPLEQGMTPERMPVDWDWRQRQWAAGEDPRPDGGESLGDGAARALEPIGSAPDGARLVLVTHGDIAAALIGHAAGAAVHQRFARHQPPTGSITELTQGADGSWSVGETWTAPLD